MENTLEIERNRELSSDICVSPDVQYYWARSYFPNLVEEDRRTMVSFDGNLYFSYLDNIDEGQYSCNVMSTVSGIGKNGPYFNLNVVPHRESVRSCWMGGARVGLSSGASYY